MDAEILETLKTISSIIGVAAMIATRTPTPKDDAILAVLHKVLNIVGANWGHAKNAEDIDEETKKKGSLL